MSTQTQPYSGRTGQQLESVPLKIRPFEDSDYAHRVRIANAVYPDRPVSEAELRHYDGQANPDPKYLNRRLVAELEGQVAGLLWYGHYEGMYHPNKLYFSLSVHPDYRRRGIGSALYAQMLEGIAAHDPVQIGNATFENQPDGIRFLKRRGFKERMRFWESALAVSTFDMAPYAGAEAKAAAHGIEIRSESELESDPDYLRKLYDMLLEVIADVPVPEPLTPEPFERFVETRMSDPNRIPEAYFVAVDTRTGHYAGTTALWRQAGDYLNTGLTGVRRAYRRKGIALALKLRAIRYAKEHGVASIRTDNESHNRPMLSINERLGFKRGTSEIAFVKDLENLDKDVANEEQEL
jgi:GNAT superfamily N-acetyltransferase